MTNVLVLESSPRAEMSATRRLSRVLLECLKAKYGDMKTTTHDLTTNPPPHVSAAVLGAFFTPEAQHTSQHKIDIQLSDQYVAELFATDVIVMGAPMWNFNIPSSLKAWIDHIVRAGKTFAYLPTGGYKGLVSGKKVYILTASGGSYSEGAMKAYDFNEPYMRAVLGFMGMTDVVYFKAEGATNPETQAKAVAAAEQKIKSHSF